MNLSALHDLISETVPCKTCQMNMGKILSGDWALDICSSKMIYTRLSCLCSSFCNRFSK